jgi:hypothetical protein
MPHLAARDSRPCALCRKTRYQEIAACFAEISGQFAAVNRLFRMSMVFGV